MAKKYHGKRSGMINGDNSAQANLPQGVVMKNYPELGYGMDERLDDTIYGVDQQINDDMKGGKRKRGTNPKKF